MLMELVSPNVKFLFISYFTLALSYYKLITPGTSFLIVCVFFPDFLVAHRKNRTEADHILLIRANNNLMFYGGLHAGLLLALNFGQATSGDSSKLLLRAKM